MIEITQLPFNAHLGIEKCAAGQHLLKLPFADHLKNHLGSFHASALFALAEASSGEFLLRHCGEDNNIGAVLRKAACKYSAPATTDLLSTSDTDPLTLPEALKTVAQKGRALTTIDIHLMDASLTTVARFSFDWFLTRQTH